MDIKIATVEQSNFTSGQVGKRGDRFQREGMMDRLDAADPVSLHVKSEQRESSAETKNEKKDVSPKVRSSKNRFSSGP